VAMSVGSSTAEETTKKEKKTKNIVVQVYFSENGMTMESAGRGAGTCRQG